MKKNLLSLATSQLLLTLMLITAMLSCKKDNDTALAAKTSLLINKKWDLQSVTGKKPDGTPVPITPDTTAYGIDNYYFYTSDGRYQFCDGALKTPGFPTGIFDEGQWQWKDAGLTLWMVSDPPGGSNWSFKISELTETDLKYAYDNGDFMMFYHYSAVP